MLPILMKTEQAVVALATSASLAAGYTPEVNVFIQPGIDTEDMATPAVICKAGDATEDFPFSGIWHVSTDISIKQMAADTANSGSAGILPDTIFKAFLVGDIEARLTAIASDYYVYQLLPRGPVDDTAGDAWTQTFQIEIVCGLV